MKSYGRFFGFLFTRHKVKSLKYLMVLMFCLVKNTNKLYKTTTRGAQIKNISFHIEVSRQCYPIQFSMHCILTSCAYCHGAFLFAEETLEHHDLTDANYKQEDSFSNGPVSDTFQKMLRLHSIVSLSESVPSL